MPVTWFQSQQAAEAPVAPLSSQQAAARWEPSVQDFVTAFGGYTIDELQQYMQERWKTEFEIEKVWLAMDAISDRGIHSYLQHHWVILKLIPCGSHQDMHSENSLQCSSTDGLSHVRSGDDTKLAEDLNALEGHVRDGDEKTPATTATAKEEQLISTEHSLSSPPAAAEAKRQKFNPVDTGSGSKYSAELQGEADPSQDCKAAANSGDTVQLADTVSLPVTLSTEAPLSAEQSKMLQPAQDHGLHLADQGKAWYLRIDRFNEADKWFACGSFENAMQSEQARVKHFCPSSELTFEGGQDAPPVPLECLLPTLSRLAEVKYSVFAKGNHCQWHAKVLTTLIASLSYFMAPQANEINPRKVTRILVDGKEQQRYAAVAGKFGGPDNNYLRSFPEAPYLKPAILDLKAYAGQHKEGLFQIASRKAFPDLQLVYASMNS